MRISEYPFEKELTGNEDFVFEKSTGTYRVPARDLKDYVMDISSATVINWEDSSVDPIDDYIYVQNMETGEQRRMNVADFISDIVSDSAQEVKPSKYPAANLPPNPDAQNSFISMEDKTGKMKKVKVSDIYTHVLDRADVTRVPDKSAVTPVLYLGIVTENGQQKLCRVSWQAVANEIKKLLPVMYQAKGSCTFEELPPRLETSEVGWVYNILNNFVTTDDFVEGPGSHYSAGTNVVRTVDKRWDCLGGTMVYGVKGSNELNYRSGQVNIRPEDIGLSRTLQQDVDEMKTVMAAVKSRLGM